MHSSLLALLGLSAALILAARCPYENMASSFLTMSNPHTFSARQSSSGNKGVFLMNRIGPSTSTLYVANVDGTNERQLLNGSTYDYHAQFSSDGQWITFTSERNGDGNSDLYRVRTDGTGLEKILATSSFEDELVLSPNGTQVCQLLKRARPIAFQCCSSILGLAPPTHVLAFSSRHLPLPSSRG